MRLQIEASLIQIGDSMSDDDLSIHMVSGEDFKLTFEIETNDVPIENLDDYSARIDIVYDEKTRVKYDETSGNITRNDADATIVFLIPSSETATLVFETAVLDLLLIPKIDGITGLRSTTENICYHKGVTEWA